MGARALHCAAIDAAGTVIAAARLSTPEQLTAWCGDADTVAIDAPEEPSTRPHADDAALAPKFRAARCAEIELGRRHGSWVSWVAPAGPPFPAWMETGFAAFAAAGDHALEVYPYAAYRELAGAAPLRPKRTTTGRAERVALLRRAGVDVPDEAEGSHDALDALVAALVARDYAVGLARRVTCGHDESAIWLPAP